MELVLRLLLGGVLLAAAGGKLRARAAARDGLIAAGVPATLAPAAVIALAAVEAALAAAVLAGIAPRAAGLAACALGLLFAAVLGAARLRGRRALPCGCFGGDGARPTWLLIARALGLAALGALVALGDLPAISRDAALVAAVVVLALAVAMLFALVLALYRQVGVLALRVAPRTALELAGEGPELGDLAPPLPGLDREGAVLVAFGSPGCRLCRALEPGLRSLARAGIVVRPVDETVETAAFADWAVPGTPFMVVVVDGTVAAKGLVNTLEEIDGLLDTALERAARAAA